MKVKELRKLTGMSQSKFAAYFGIPTATLQDWEHGRRKPPSYIYLMLQRILKAELGIEETKEGESANE